MTYRHRIFFLSLLLSIATASGQSPLHAQTKKNIRFERLSLEQGLSQSSVNAVLQDERGLMWIATQDGLNTYDGYRFRVYKPAAGDPHSLSSNYVLSLVQDGAGDIWVGTWGGGLNRFNRQTGGFDRFLPVIGDPDSLSHNEVRVLYLDPDREKQGLWIGTEGGGLNYLDIATERFTRIQLINDKREPNNIWAITKDRGGTLWVGTYGGGLCYRNPDSTVFKSYRHNPEDNDSLAHDIVLSVLEDRQERLWVGTYGGGLDQLDRETGKFTHYANDASKPNNSLSDNEVTVLFEDPDPDENILWVGTNGGLNRFHTDSGKCVSYRHQPTVSDSLSRNKVQALYRDRTGIFWVGTSNGGLNKFNRGTEVFNHYRNQPDNPNSLSDNDVRSFLVDSEGFLWVGTVSGGLNKFNRERNQVTHFVTDPEDTSSLCHNRVQALLEDSKDRFWVGTYGGLAELDRSTNRFTTHPVQDDGLVDPRALEIRLLVEDSRGRLWVGTRGGGLAWFFPDHNIFTFYKNDPLRPESLGHDRVYAVHEQQVGEPGILWLGTWGGLDRFDPEADTFRHFKADPNNEQSLSHPIVISIYEDPVRYSGLLWIGTLGGGFNRFDMQRETFVHYREKDGLPNDVVYGILGDDEGYLWLSTNQGLARFHPETESFRVYDWKDGLQSNEFNGGAFLKGPGGDLFFGGINGFNVFNPANLVDDPHRPAICITGFLLLNERIRYHPGQKPSPLKKPIEEAEELAFNYDEASFTLELAAMHYANPNKNRFSYMLEGYDSSWIHLDVGKRDATYTKLDPGSYTFLAKARNKDGLWNEEPARLRILVTPPPWLTWWAYILYVLTGIGLLYWYLHYRERKIERERLLEYERYKANREYTVAQRLRLLDKLKDEFLANTSHELRTPLNGIIGLAESLMDGVAGPLPIKASNNLSMIASSGRRLANLVNDLLDFSRLNEGNLKLERQPLDLARVSGTVVALLQPLADQKKLQIVNEIDDTAPAVEADENRLRQILHNLLGNAIKYTESGSIRISALREGGWLAIQVADTGIGIAPERLDRVFDSFVQADGTTTRDQGGTGLGLTITKQFVELHGGRINLTSTPAVGSVFTFTLPIAKGPVAEDPTAKTSRLQTPVTTPIQTPAQATEPITEPCSDPKNEINILVVDDDPVNRQVLLDYLTQANYRVVGVSGGNEALETLEKEPACHLVLLDIMMPGMSGYETCRRLRERHGINSLPVIFLTAKNQVNDLVTGYAAGANDYLIKPISKQELLSRVKRHLELLDINRALEHKVTERTAELESRNREILRTQKQLLTQEKLASLGTLTAGIAHEIKNPLNFVNNFAELSMGLVAELRSGIESHIDALPEVARDNFSELLVDLEQNAATICKHGERANAIIRGMMNLARGESDEWRPTDVNMLADQFTRLAYHGSLGKMENQRIQLSQDFDEGAGEVEAVAQNLSRVIINLVNNAMDAVSAKTMQQDEHYSPTVRVTTKGCPDHVEISVWDNGNGIAKKNLDKLFHPFFTTKPTGSGNIGLGLYISYDIIVSEHGGDLRVTSKEGEFTEFTIKLPREKSVI